jgi:hypothetical protein
MINPTYPIAASLSWASGQITITSPTPTGFTVNWHDRARRSDPIGVVEAAHRRADRLPRHFFPFDPRSVSRPSNVG